MVTVLERQLVRILRQAMKHRPKVATCVTRAEAARRMGMTLKQFRTLERLGAILLVKVGRRCLVPVSELRHAGVA